jgi:uncharacterized repeat protein (TIGR04076 family)
MTEDAMKRREFLKCSAATGIGAGIAALAARGDTEAGQDASQPRPARPRYAFEVEIVEGQCNVHRAGQKIAYPAEKGAICPWLMDSMSGAIRVLEYGGTLPWLYEGTPYEKVIDPQGVTTEFIRCPDPTRVVVAKITRRRV